MIKPLKLDDINEIVATHQGFSDGWTAEMLLGGFSKGGLQGSGFYSNGKMVGYIIYTPYLDFTDLEMIFVKKEFRKQGVAGALMETMLKSTSNKILLEVRAGNSSAIALYKKFGFQNLSVRKKYYPDGENALVMVKEID